MDRLTFIASVIASLGWPVSIAFIAWLFRLELKSALSSLRLKRLKGGSFEAEFGEQLKDAQNEIQELHRQGVIEDAPPDPRFVALLDTHPEYAVLDAWKDLESEINRISSARHDIPARAPLSRKVALLVKYGDLSPEILSAIYEISNVRNSIVHSNDRNLGKHYAKDILDMIADISLSIGKIV